MLGKLLRERYQIVQVLSAGGFCQTYLAEDISLANKPTCVVKHLIRTTDQESSVETLRELFTREAEALEKLRNYDHVPQLLAHFEEQREFYLVQEFIPGQTLSAELEPGKRWSESAVVRLLQEVLSILEYVHSQGLIHRDLKPSNLIRRYPEQKIVLVDFGSVKQVWTQVVTNQGQTSTSFSIGMPATIAIGTPGYMPSEQARGRPRPNSDLYALGIIAIQALTGLNPRQLLEDSDTGELIWQHNVKVSPALASVLTKMTRYHFQERYESATDALQALQPLISQQALRRQAVNRQQSSPKVLGQRSLTTLVPQKVPTTETVAGVPKRPKLHLSHKSDVIPTPNKSVLVGIATSIAVGLIIGSYYFLRSPTPAQNSVSLGKNSIFGNISLDKTLTGHSDSVWSVAISRDHQIVSSSGDQTIKIWHLHTGKLLRTLQGHSNQVLSVAISPDNQIIASSSWDKTIKIWHLHTGELLHTLAGNSKELWSVAISPDSQTLVSGSNNINKIWNLRTGKLQRTLSNHLDTVWSVAISPDGQAIASGSKDQTINIWHLPTGMHRTLTGHSGRVRAVAFSPDNQNLASSSWDQTIKIWHLHTGKLLHTLSGHSAYVNCIAISPDNQILASGSDDDTIKLWNLRTGELLHTLKGHSNNVNSVAFDVDGKILVSGSEDNTIKVWQLRSSNISAR